MNLQLAVQRVCGSGPEEKDIRRWAEAALAHEGRQSAELTVRIVDEDESAALNQRYRNKRGPTNVLSFGCELPPGVDSDLLGDLVICAPVVVREAREQGKPEAAHWAHMIVHGVLHLLGFDHIDEQDARNMERREIAIMAQLGFANPYEPDCR